MKKIFSQLVILFIFTIASISSAHSQTSDTAEKPAPTEKSDKTKAIKKTDQNSTDPFMQKPGQANDPGETGVAMGNVYTSCRKYFERTFNTQENFAKKAICNGYFFGIGSTLLTMQMGGVRFDTMCLPKDISTEKIIEVFLTWAEKKTDKFPMPATQAVFESLAEMYPCQ